MIPLLQNILAQAENLARVCDYHHGVGQSELGKAARVIGNARRLVLSGMGSSLYACYSLSNYLAAHGIAATVLDAAELLHYQFPACRDAVVVLVSRSGESVEVVKALPLLQAQGATIVGATNAEDSTLAHAAHHVIALASRADQAVAVQTYTATLAALGLLGGAAIGELEVAETALHELIAAMESSLGEWVAGSETWCSFLERAHPVYLLARGASTASALEGALLFHEVAKLPAVSMGAGNFRHGPLEVIDAEFRALVFSPQDSSRELNLALGREIAARGGQARCIGPGADWRTPEVAAAFAPAIEIVPVQLAAFRLAERRGLAPGQLRFTSQVTRTEMAFSSHSEAPGVGNRD